MQRDKFVEALFIPYVYDCQGKEVALADEKTSLERGRYFVVHCTKCCEVTVLHMLRRKGERE